MTARQELLLPVFLHVLLTLALGVILCLARRNALKDGKARVREVVLDTRQWPDHVRKLANNFDNQFQLPMLWYAGVAFTLILGLADIVAVALSWAFLAARIAHSYVHIGRNILVRRFFVFVVGAMILSLYWLWLALQVFG
jgi:hypothetical protein